MNTNRLFKKAVNLLTLASFLVWNLAMATPEGGQVAAGSAAITQSGTTTTINQTSQNTVINWSGFDTASHEAVNFVQPNSSSIALNRINSGQPTNFQGSLSANGQVWILNPSGVLFGANSTVDVAGLLVTTHNITDSNFMAGNYQFTFDPNSANAKIINNGLITAKDSGIVGLVAPWVENNGVITAHLGKVHLASGSSFVLDMYGDSLINFGSSAPAQNGYVSNSGLIKADGGKVYMTAKAAAGVLDNIISMSGTIEAKAVSVNQKGQIVLHGGSAGKVKVTGTLNASTGGFVETSGADIDTSEATLIIGSGGTWLIDPPGDLTINPVDRAGIEAQLNSGVSVTYTAPAGSVYLATPITALTMPGIITSFTLTASADVHIDNPVTLTGLGGFAANAGGTIFLNTASMTTPFGKIYNAPTIIMQQSITLSGGGADTFVGTLDGDGLGPWDLLTTSSGGVFFNSDVGVVNPLNSIDLNGTSFAISFNSGSPQTIQTFNSQRYRTTTFLTAPAVTFRTVNQGPAVHVEFDDILNGNGAIPSDFTVDGNLLIGNPNGTIGFMNLAFSLIGNVLVTGSATGIIISNVTTGSNGDQTYMGPVTLIRNDILVSGGTITFMDTVNGDGLGLWNLDITAPLTVFNQTVGATRALNNLTITGATNINTASIQTERNQVYGGPVTLSADTVLTSNIQDITFTGTVNGPGGLIANVTNGTMFANGHMGSGTPLGYLTVNGTAQGVNIISVGDINMGPFNVVTNDFVQSLAGNVNFTSGPVTLVSGNLTVLAAEQIFFGFGAGGVTGPGFTLSASSFNPIYGPTGAGISGSVDVAQFSMGGVGGGDVSPISQDSFVTGQGLQQAFINTTILGGSSGFYCVNGFCSLIAPPTSSNLIPNNIPPKEIFEFVDVVNTCGVNGCGDLVIYIHHITPTILNCSSDYKAVMLGRDTAVREKTRWVCTVPKNTE